MPRIKRLINQSEPTIYHVMSRTALDGLPFGDAEKDRFLEIIRKFKEIFFVEMMGFCIMGNHFHLLVKTFPEAWLTDDEIKRRYLKLYGDEKEFPEVQIPKLRKKWSSLSEFVKEIKQTFSRYYNKEHDRKGTLWGERFKSVIVENGNTLIHCLAYIDLNPIRAGIVKRPEDYRWNSLGYHIQTGNPDRFLSTDFGISEFNHINDEKERLRLYRRYVYQAGALERRDKKPAAVIDPNILASERETDFNMDRVNRFRNRTRYFSDSGIIGSKEFVRKQYQQFKHYFQSRREKLPKTIKGLDGIYSLKRLSEVI